MSKELDYLDDILKNEPLTLNKRMVIEGIKEKIQRLESIENAKSSEALEYLETFLREMKDIEQCTSNYFEAVYWKYKNTFETIIKQALETKSNKEQILDGIVDYLDNRIKCEPIDIVRKAFEEIRHHIDILDEVISGETIIL